MAAIAEQFAHIEQAASALVDELEGLRSETQHYSAAAASLEVAGHRLGSLAVEATDLSTRAAEVLTALKEIGTPQLLSGLEALTARYSEHSAQLGALDRMIREATDKTAAAGGSIQVLATDLRQGYSETAHSLKQVLTRLDHVGTTLESHVVSSDQRLHGLMGETTRLLRMARLAVLAAGAGLGASLVTLVYMLVTHR